MTDDISSKFCLTQPFRGSYNSLLGFPFVPGFAMRTLAASGVPEDFKLVGIPLPYRTGDVLGYVRGERFVGFYWDRLLGPMWDDGVPIAADPSVWISYISIAAKLEEHYEANIGSSASDATHMLVWDRWRQKGYIASKESGQRFLRGRIPQRL